MKRPSLLYASPFPPMKSGISDYSEMLVRALQERFDITLYTDDYEISNKDLKKSCRIVRDGRDKIDFSGYDYRIYNIGNNPEFHNYIYEACFKYPGMIILHDLVLYYLFVGYYQEKKCLYSKVFKEEGLEAFREIKQAVKRNGPALLMQKYMAEKLPLNKELLRSGNKIMVHSLYSYNKILQMNLADKGQVAKINMIKQVGDDEPVIPKEKLFQKYHIPMDAYVIASMGYIGPTKLNHVVCEAVKQIEKSVDSSVCYVMAGEGDYVDEYVDGRTVIKTGYTELEEFNSFIEHSDLIVNLRNPSMGETSGAMLRILQKGKPCVINEGGWFSEIPDDCVVKVSLQHLQEELERVLEEFIHDPRKGQEISRKAKEYVEREYSGSKVVKEIEEFLKR